MAANVSPDQAPQCLQMGIKTSAITSKGCQSWQNWCHYAMHNDPKACKLYPDQSHRAVNTSVLPRTLCKLPSACLSRPKKDSTALQKVTVKFSSSKWTGANSFPYCLNSDDKELHGVIENVQKGKEANPDKDMFNQLSTKLKDPLTVLVRISDIGLKAHKGHSDCNVYHGSTKAFELWNTVMDAHGSPATWNDSDRERTLVLIPDVTIEESAVIECPVLKTLFNAITSNPLQRGNNVIGKCFPNLVVGATSTAWYNFMHPLPYQLALPVDIERALEYRRHMLLSAGVLPDRILRADKGTCLGALAHLICP